MSDYPHESNQSELQRFNAACKEAELTESEKDRFSKYYHSLPDRQRMEFKEIVRIAREWKQDYGGGFRRSDR